MIHWTKNKRYYMRSLTHYFFFTLATIAMGIGLFWLIWILYTLILHGYQALHFTIFLRNTAPPESPGGLANAIVGSLEMVVLAILLAIPIGVLAGIYLAEFGRNNRFAQMARILNDILLSTPSILIGLFIYQLIVLPSQHFSGWAGTIALCILAIPTIVRVTEDMLRLVPIKLREATSALGAPPFRVIFSMALRVARTGIVTGILLAIARISGETAPLLFTALNNQFWNLDLQKPMPNLPSVIYQYAMSPYSDWHQLAWTGALLITLWVLLLNIIVRVLQQRK